jgi:hypothetical protein
MAGGDDLDAAHGFAAVGESYLACSRKPAQSRSQPHTLDDRIVAAIERSLPNAQQATSGRSIFDPPGCFAWWDFPRRIIVTIQIEKQNSCRMIIDQADGRVTGEQCSRSDWHVG